MYTIIDTGSNAIYFSALYYEVFIRKIFANVKAASNAKAAADARTAADAKAASNVRATANKGEAWKMVDGIVQTPCYNFPPLYFMFDNKWIMVNPADYVIDISPA